MNPAWTPTSEQKEQLFSELGRCLYVFQAIEIRLKVLLPHLVPPGQEASLTSADFSNWRFYLDSKATLGPLIQKLKEHVESESPEMLDKAWRQLVQHRNEVIHHYLEQSFSPLDTESKFKEAMAFLKHRRVAAAPMLVALQNMCAVLIQGLPPDDAFIEPTTTH